MTVNERTLRRIESFVHLLDDSRKDFEGFLRDVENLRFSRTPIDNQQVNRSLYALNNMEGLLVTIQDSIRSGLYEGEGLDALVQTKNDWVDMKKTADEYIEVVLRIVEGNRSKLAPVLQAVEGRF